jgi:hypothetical protein
MVPLFELFAFRHRDSRTESRFALGRAGRGRSSCDTRNEISGARRSAASTWSRVTSLRTRHRWMQHCYNEQPLELEPAIDAAEAFLLSVFSGGTLPAAPGAAGRRHERSGSPIGTSPVRQGYETPARSRRVSVVLGNILPKYRGVRKWKSMRSAALPSDVGDTYNLMTS